MKVYVLVEMYGGIPDSAHVFLDKTKANNEYHDSMETSDDNPNMDDPRLFQCDIDDIQEYIRCVSCGYTSYNSNDIKNKYCGKCHKYHKSVQTYQLGFIQIRVDDLETIGVSGEATE